MTHRFQIKFVCIESIHCFDWFDSIAKKGWNKYSTVGVCTLLTR